MAIGRHTEVESVTEFASRNLRNFWRQIMNLIKPAAIEERPITYEAIDAFNADPATLEFRQMRVKNEATIDDLARKIRGVLTGETPVSFAVIEDCREMLLQLYQLQHIFEAMSVAVGAASGRFASKICADINGKVSAARSDFCTIQSWAKKVPDDAARGQPPSVER